MYQDDVRAFLQWFKGQLDERGRKVRGITTDGSSLYPEVLKELWPDARHQLCAFHVLKEITKAVLHALAVLRKEMAAKIPKLPRGRPGKEQQPLTRKAKRQKQRSDVSVNQGILWASWQREPPQRVKRGGLAGVLLLGLAPRPNSLEE
jgi:transposase